MSHRTQIRFYTSAALRDHEEVAGEIVGWLPRAITVEYQDAMPVTGIWRSSAGDRRICWYATEYDVTLGAAHEERYGNEPFWVIDRTRLGDGQVRVIECDADGRGRARRTWTFDRAHMPSLEEECSFDGAERCTRSYECTPNGVVFASTERRPGAERIVVPRPVEFPAPELSGDVFPCGGTITRTGPRLVEPIAGNSYQKRLVAVYQDGTVWRRGLATIATMKKDWPHDIRPLLDFSHPLVAPLVHEGSLVDRRHQGFPFVGVVEALPTGKPLDELVRTQQVLSPRNAVTLALEIAEVARAAHAAGLQLGGIRPELTYVRHDGVHCALTGIAHRGPAVIAATYSGEQVRWPPVFPADFSSPEDTRALAQLVWFALTGGHPYLAPDDLRWNSSWNEFRHHRTSRQAWTGPASIGPILGRVLFGSPGERGFEAFVEELRTVLPDL